MSISTGGFPCVSFFILFYFIVIHIEKQNNMPHLKVNIYTGHRYIAIMWPLNLHLISFPAHEAPFSPRRSATFPPRVCVNVKELEWQLLGGPKPFT